MPRAAAVLRRRSSWATRSDSVRTNLQPKWGSRRTPSRSAKAGSSARTSRMPTSGADHCRRRDYHGHAVERYAQRVRPGGSLSATERELRAVAECAGLIVGEPPDRIDEEQDHRDVVHVSDAGDEVGN